MKISNSNYSTLKVQAFSKAQDKTSNVAFRGITGDKAVEIVLKNKDKVVEKGVIASLLVLVGSIIGLNKEKVSDVFETFANKIKGLSTEKESLELRNADLLSQLERANRDRLTIERNANRLVQEKNAVIAEKNAEIQSKDNKIAQLQKYEALGKVKSVEELDIVTPEQFLTLLKEGMEAMPKARESVLNYLFTGQGQEEFLAQMERSNKILKARIDGITEMPEMQEAYKKSCTYLGLEPIYVAQEMMAYVLKQNEKGAQVNYPPVRAQLLENMNALIEPLKTKNQRYKANEAVLNEVVDFYKNLDSNMKELLLQGWNFKERKINDMNGAVYCTFTNNNKTFDIYLNDLAYHNFGFGRVTDAEGRVSTGAHKEYWGM